MMSNNDDDVNTNDTIATAKDKDNDYNSIEKDNDIQMNSIATTDIN